MDNWWPKKPTKSAFVPLVCKLLWIDLDRRAISETHFPGVQHVENTWKHPLTTKRYHALTWLPQKAHLRISPNGIADMCTRENSQTIGITMDIFPSPSMLETRHFIFPCEGQHCVFWGLSSSRQSCISDILGNRLVCMLFASLRMLQVTQVDTTCFPGYAGHVVGWVGWGGGWGCDNVRWNFHTWSMLHVFHGTHARAKHEGRLKNASELRIRWCSSTTSFVRLCGGVWTASVPVYNFACCFFETVCFS